MSVRNKSKNKIIIFLVIFSIISLIPSQTVFSYQITINQQISETGKNNNSYNKHNPIYINGNSEFTQENGVLSGNGTKKNPYVIEGWDILSKKGKNKNSYGIQIENTDSYFVIKNCYIHHFNRYISHLVYLFKWTSDWGIRLYNVSNGIIDNCYITGTGHTIRLNNSKNNVISNCYYDNNGCGIGIFDNSFNNTIKNCNSHNYVCGICIYYNSYNNTVLNCSTYLSFTSLHSRFHFLLNNGLGSGWIGFYIFEKCSNNKIINCKSYSYEKPFKNRFIKKFYTTTIEGFFLTRNSNNNTIKECLAYNLPVGIKVEGSDSSNTIKDCTLTNNYYGIYSKECPNDVYKNNTFIDNKYDKINI